MASGAWTITRLDDELRINVTESASFSQGETQAIVHALEDKLDKDGVTTVRLGGPVLHSQVRSRLTPLIGHLFKIVNGRGLRFHVGPL